MNICYQGRRLEFVDVYLLRDEEASLVERATFGPSLRAIRRRPGINENIIHTVNNQQSTTNNIINSNYIPTRSTLFSDLLLHNGCSTK